MLANRPVVTRLMYDRKYWVVPQMFLRTRPRSSRLSKWAWLLTSRARPRLYSVRLGKSQTEHIASGPAPRADLVADIREPRSGPRAEVEPSIFRWLRRGQIVQQG